MNAEQYEVLFYKMRDKLFRYALRYVKDADSAEDVVQDVMYKLWQKRQEVDTIENLEACTLVMLATNQYWLRFLWLLDYQDFEAVKFYNQQNLFLPFATSPRFAVGFSLQSGLHK